MSRLMMRLALLAALLGVIAIAGLATSSASETSEEIILPIPCDPVLDRTITPLIVDQGDEVNVDVHYNYRCTGRSRRINYFLLIENTTALRPGGKLELLKNLKKGLSNFVNNVDYSNGSQGGMTLYAGSYQNRVTLQGGDTGRQNLLDAIGLISTEADGGVAGVPGAVRDAHERLPDNVESNVTNVLLIVDAGAQIDPNGPTMSDLNTSCAVANQNTLMILVGLRPAGNRLAQFGCVDSGWFKYSPTEDGSDLPQVFSEIAEKLVKGQLSSSTEYFDSMNGYDFTYVVGSGVPQEPDNPWGSEYSWSFPVPGAGGQVVEYRAKAVAPDVPAGGKLTNLSNQVQLCLNYKDGSQQCGDAPNPPICVRRKGVSSDCANYEATLTPQAPATVTPTMAPTETPTPTEMTPTEAPVTPTVPVDTPEPTEPSTGQTIFLPSLVNRWGG